MNWPVRVALLATLVLLAVGAAVVFSEQRDVTARNAAAEEHERVAAKERRAVEIERDQRPRTGRSVASPATAAPAEQFAKRDQALNELRAAIGTDARERVRAGKLDGPIVEIECERFPRADSADLVVPERDLSISEGRYSCLAVTRRFKGGVFGHPYRALLDFTTGEYAYCKITGSPELARDPRLATPRACGGLTA